MLHSPLSIPLPSPTPTALHGTCAHTHEHYARRCCARSERDSSARYMIYCLDPVTYSRMFPLLPCDDSTAVWRANVPAAAYLADAVRMWRTDG